MSTIPEAEIAESRQNRLDEFMEKTGLDAESEFGVADALDAIENVYGCGHQCTSNCKRVGCNCDCGEYHIEVKENTQKKIDHDEYDSRLDEHNPFIKHD